jgi:hypothetical protein
VVADDPDARGAEINRLGGTFNLRENDGAGDAPLALWAGTGRLKNLPETLAKAKTMDVLAGPYSSDGRDAVMVQFPGGYIAMLSSCPDRGGDTNRSVLPDPHRPERRGQPVGGVMV